MNAFCDPLCTRLREAGLIAVLVIDNADDAVPLANALLAGGVTAIELTLRTDAAFEALGNVCREVPEMITGVGTVISPEQVLRVCELNGAYAVAPGTNAAVIEAAGQAGLPFAPGVCTPSDIETAIGHGCRLLKFFPAEAMGGLHYLKTIGGPYQHLGLEFIPLGGIHPGNVADYLVDAAVHSVGGSWIAPRELIRRQAWDQITENARRGMRIVSQVRRGSR